MAATIKIDQVGRPAGVAGQSRSDGLATGAVVTLTSTVPGTTNTWELLWTPDADTTAVPTLVLSGVTSTFTPTAGVYGTYRIKLTVDATLVTESISIRTLSILTPIRSLRIPALNERANPDATLATGSIYVAESETNEPVAGGHFVGGSYGGWYAALVDLITKFEALVSVTFGTPGAIAVGDSAAAGSASTAARSDHVHALAAPAAPANVTKAAAAAGTAATVARSDHKHDITTAAPGQGIGSANSEGTSTALSRADHNHALRTTTGPTDLAIGAVADGEFLKRVGTAIVSAAISGGTQTVQEEGVTQSSVVTTFNFVGLYVTASGGGATATITLAPLGGTTAARPVTPAQYTNYFDTTLGLPIWYVGAVWVDAAGVTV